MGINLSGPQPDVAETVAAELSKARVVTMPEFTPQRRRIDELAGRLDATEPVVGEAADGLARLTAQVADLAARLTAMEQRLASLPPGILNPPKK